MCDGRWARACYILSLRGGERFIFGLDDRRRLALELLRGRIHFQFFISNNMSPTEGEQGDPFVAGKRVVSIEGLRDLGTG